MTGTLEGASGSLGAVYIRALAEVSTVPANADESSPTEVVDNFLRILDDVLRLDLIYARVEDPRGGPPIEAARSKHANAEARAPSIGRELALLVGSGGRTTVGDPFGRSGELHTAVVPLASGTGAVAAFSRRESFPTQLESMLLKAALNHLALWVLLTRSKLEARRATAALAERENRDLRGAPHEVTGEIATAVSFGGIVGQSPALHTILGEVELVAPTDATVLVLGESGTGKELLAREIHERSRRAAKPLVKVNCSAIPREMFESEFFGHVRGAFTGAVRDRPGRFQLAEKGTIFLDEVGDLPLDLQPKLLRVLQEGQYERVGDDATRTVDVRVIAATNRDLAADVSAGRFREDLYYRLSVFPLRLPPLRERKQDIVPLAAHFVARVSSDLGEPVPSIPERQLAALRSYDWPGNVRELVNVVERAVILARGGELRFDRVLAERASERTRSSSPHAPASPPQEEIIPDHEWRRRERANLVAALARTSGRIYGAGGAAELLGIKPSTLQSRLRALGIRPRGGS